MLENEFLPASERLTAFIDGELGTDEASSLFYELSQSPELQQEMKELLTIRDAFRNSQVAPPDYLKESIVGAVGLGGGIGAALTGFFTNRFALTAIGVVAVIITAFLLFRDGGTQQPEPMQAGQIQQKEIPVTESMAPAESIPGEIAENTLAINADVIPPAKSSKKNSPVANNRNSPANQNAFVPQESADSGNESQAAESSRVNDIFASMSYGTGSPGGFAGRGINLNNLGSLDISRFFDRVSILLYNANIGLSPADSDFESMVPQYSQPLMINSGVALEYELNPGHHVGIEANYNRYNLQYRFIDNGVLKQQEKIWNTFMAGAYYKYYLADWNLYYETRLYGKTGLGATTLGPTGNLELGLEWYLRDNLHIITGLSGDGLLFKSENDYYYSTNYGLKIGARFNF